MATFFKLPVSTSQSIVGGIAGVGFAAGADLNLAKVGTIVQVWVICPLLTGLLAFGLYWVFRRLFARYESNSIWQRVPNALLILSACYVGFSMGANNVGNAMGPIANLGMQAPWLGALGGVALAMGTLTFGRRVTETVGSGITMLDPVSALSAQTAAALAIHYFSILGIPISTSQAVVGAVIGVGLVHGIRTVKARKIAGIAIGWIATPTIAGLIAFVLFKVVLRLSA